MSGAKITSYRDLLIWQRSVKLVGACYRLSANFPRDERFGLTAQMRRSAVSIPSNIAEGFGRETTGAYVQFLRVAQGSLKELETQILIAVEIDIATTESVAALLNECDEIGKMLRGYIRSIDQG